MFASVMGLGKMSAAIPSLHPMPPDTRKVALRHVCIILPLRCGEQKRQNPQRELPTLELRGKLK
jgi:hypothetical protein